MAGGIGDQCLQVELDAEKSRQARDRQRHARAALGIDAGGHRDPGADQQLAGAERDLRAQRRQQHHRAAERGQALSIRTANEAAPSAGTPPADSAGTTPPVPAQPAP